MSQKSHVPTPQESANFANLVLKNTPPGLMVIDLEANQKAAAEYRRAQDAANPVDPEKNWRGELDELERRLKGAWTEKQARDNVAAVERDQNQAVKAIEKAVKELREALHDPYLEVHRGWTGTETEPWVIPRSASGRGGACGCDGCAILKKIESLEWKLSEAKRVQQRKIRQAGETVKACRELDKLRPRFRELAERASKIDEATRHVKELTSRFEPEGEPSRGFPGAHKPSV